MTDAAFFPRKIPQFATAIRSPNADRVGISDAQSSHPPRSESLRQSDSGKPNVTVGNAELWKLWTATMVSNDTELKVTLARIRRMQVQRALLRKTETNATNYRLSASGFIAEIDRMQLDVGEYLSTAADLAHVG